MTSGDKSRHQVLAQNLVHATKLPVIVPNYRLSPQVSLGSDVNNASSNFKHPGHAEDMALALSKIHDFARDSPQIDNEFIIFLAGHSCGAHMISTLILEPPEGERTKLEAPLPQGLHNLIRGVIVIEGIYDLDLLLSDFPDYRDFIDGAFPAAIGDKEENKFSQFSVNHYARRSGAITPWLVLHSPNDTLVNMIQAQVMHDHLMKEYSEVDTKSSLIHHDFETLTGDHDDLLESPELIRLIFQTVQAWM